MYLNTIGCEYREKGERKGKILECLIITTKFCSLDVKHTDLAFEINVEKEIFNVENRQGGQFMS